MALIHWNGDQAEKTQFHRTYLRKLRAIANQLGLTKADFDIRSNKAGPASLGEVTLHTEKFYLQVGGLQPKQVLFRTCNGRKDYTGGQNFYFPIELFDTDLNAVLDNLRRN